MTVPSPILAPSLLAADFARLAEAAHAVEREADWLHVDVMDNHFVPNLTMGLPVVQSLRRATSLPLDVHLMIEEPERSALGYAQAGSYNVSFHVEAAADPVGLARDLRAAGTRAGLAIDRDTPVEPYLEILSHFDTLLIMTIKAGFGGQDLIPELLAKVRTARAHIRSGHLNLRLEVDGGVGEDTIAAAAEAGADAFVAGTAVYGADDPAEAVRRLRLLAQRAIQPPAPGTVQAAAPGTVQTAAPGTVQAAAPGTVQTAALDAAHDRGWDAGPHPVDDRPRGPRDRG